MSSTKHVQMKIDSILNKLSQKAHNPPKDAIIPTLNNRDIDSTIKEISIIMSSKTKNIPPEIEIQLKGFGLPINEGYIRWYNGRIIHEIMAIKVDNREIELRSRGLLYWFDPLSGLILKQIGEKSFRISSLDDIFRELNKKLAYMRGAPVYTGIDAIRAVMEAGRESQLEKAFGPPKGGSSRALFTTRTIRTGSGWTRSLSKEDEEYLKKLIEYGGDEIREIIEEILRRNPDPAENLYWLAYATKYVGPEITIKAIKCIMERRWRFPNEPNFGSTVARTAGNLEWRGECSPF